MTLALSLLQISLEPELRPSPNLFEEWMLVVFLVVLLNIAYVRIAYQRRLQRMFSSLIRLQILRQVMREELVFSHRASVLLFLNFVLLASLIVYLALKYFGWHLPLDGGLISYLAIALGIAALYVLKLTLSRFLRWLLRDSGLIREYMFEVFLVNKVAGLFAVPVALGLAFLNVGNLSLFFWILLVAAAFMLIYRTLLGLIMSVSYPVSRIYIILYLCSLELLPFLVLIKALHRELI